MQNNLIHLEEFRELLKNYHISDTGQELLRRIKLVLLVAPTGSGRNTVINELIKPDDYHFIVSDTTRLPRVNNGVPEQDGREYWFRSEEQMLKELKNGELLEAAIIHNQQVSGISLRELRKGEDETKFVTDIEIVGADNIHNVYPEAYIFFLLPPSFKEWVERLHKRGGMPSDELNRRMQSAIDEIEFALRHAYYEFIINDSVENTAKLIDLYVHGQIDQAGYQVSAKKIANEILETLKQEVKSGKIT